MISGRSKRRNFLSVVFIITSISKKLFIEIIIIIIIDCTGHLQKCD